MTHSASAPLRRGLPALWRERPRPLHPLLLAVWPVLFLYGQNVGELQLAELVLPLVVVALAALVLLVGATFLVRDGRRAALIVTGVVLALLLYGHVAELLGPLGPRPWMQQIGWAVVVVVVVVLALRIGRTRLAGVTRALNVVGAVLIAVSLATIVPAEIARAGPGTSVTTPEIGGSQGTGRDIYYLVFDRYGSARSLDLLYDIDDEPFLDRLRDRGFQVLPDSHANYVRTTLSLAATLNLDYLDDVVGAQDPGSNDYGPINDRLADHAVGRFLRERGYQYVHVGSGYGPTETSRIADRNPRVGEPSDFQAALLDSSALPAIARRLGIIRTTPDRERRYRVTRFELDTLDQLATEPGPKFVFSHMLIPHPPYIFARDGSFVTDELDGARSRSEAYGQQLQYLQGRIETLVDRLLDRPEAERPIIILQADEGPYPARYGRDADTFDWATATTDELETKYGIFNAIYLPGTDVPDVAPTLSSVNTFRLVFDEYFDADLPLLPDRSFTSANRLRPYDLTEITDRLPSLGTGP
jgi:hypothetical protein